MSLIPIGLTVGLAAAEGLLAAIFGSRSNIGGIFPDVVVEENHSDELVITDNPVEQSANISDHAFKQPVEVTLKVGFSDSSLQAGGDPNYVIEMYQALLTLQAARSPFAIVTTKRLYQNMLIRRLTTTTDRRWSKATILVADCREVIITTTQTVTVPPAANMASPQTTAEAAAQGPQQLQSAGTSPVVSAPVSAAEATQSGTAGSNVTGGSGPQFNWAAAPFSGG